MAPTCAIHFTPNVVALPDEMVGSALVPESPGFPWNWGHVYPELDAPTGRDQLPPKTTAHTATTAHTIELSTSSSSSFSTPFPMQMNTAVRQTDRGGHDLDASLEAFCSTQRRCVIPSTTRAEQHGHNGWWPCR